LEVIIVIVTYHIDILLLTGLELVLREYFHLVNYDLLLSLG